MAVFVDEAVIGKTTIAIEIWRWREIGLLRIVAAIANERVMGRTVVAIDTKSGGKVGLLRVVVGMVNEGVITTVSERNRERGLLGKMIGVLDRVVVTVDSICWLKVGLLISDMLGPDLSRLYDNVVQGLRTLADRHIRRL